MPAASSLPDLKIQISADKGNTTAVLTEVSKDVEKVSAETKKAGAEVKKGVGEEIAKSSAKAAEKTKTFSASVTELSTKLREMKEKGSQSVELTTAFTKVLEGVAGKGSQVASMFGSLAGSFAAGGMVGLGVAAVGLLVTKLNDLSEAEKKASKEMNDWFTDLHKRAGEAKKTVQELEDEMNHVPKSMQLQRQLNVDTKKYEEGVIKQLDEQMKKKEEAAQRLAELSKGVSSLAMTPLNAEDPIAALERETARYTAMRDSAEKKIAELTKKAGAQSGDISATADVVRATAALEQTKQQEERDQKKVEATKEYEGATNQAADALVNMRRRVTELSLDSSGLEKNHLAVAKALLALKSAYEDANKAQKKVLNPADYKQWSSEARAAFEAQADAVRKAQQVQERMAADVSIKQMTDKVIGFKDQLAELNPKVTKLASTIRQLTVEYDAEVKVIKEGTLSSDEKYRKLMQLSDAYNDAQEAARKYYDAMSADKTKQATKALDEYLRKLREQAIQDPSAKRQSESFNEFNKLITEAGIAKGSDVYTKKYEEMAAAIKKIDEAEQDAKNGLKAWEDQAKSSIEGGIETGINDLLTTTGTVDDAFKKMGNTFVQVLEQMYAKLVSSQILNLLSKLGSLSGGASGAAGSPGVSNTSTFAEGGFVRGPGGPKSDSIPSMLSDGEYVLTAEAVNKYGVSFLDAMNGMKSGPSSAMHRYASGGAVTSGGGAPSTVNVINNTGQEAKVERSQGPDGRDLINVIIGKLAQDVRDGGVFSKTVQQTFGLGRHGFGGG